MLNVKSAALTLKRVDNVHGSYGLTASMLSVGDGVSNEVLKEDLEDTANLFVDKTRHTLDTTSARKSSDCGISDPLDIVSQDLAVIPGASLSHTFSSFSSAIHVK
jgi:hypothetical protein